MAAAWVLVGLVLGLLGGWLVRGQWASGQARADKHLELVMTLLNRPALTPEVADIVRQLALSAAGERVKGEPEGGDQPTHEPEYEPPMDDALDWTDGLPDLGEERPLVARLSPGQSIPGLDGEPVGQTVDPVEQWRMKGAGAFDEWAAETLDPDPWVQPRGFE